MTILACENSGQQVADLQTIRKRQVHGCKTKTELDPGWFTGLFRVQSRAMFRNGLGQQVSDQRAAGKPFSGFPVVYSSRE